MVTRSKTPRRPSRQTKKRTTKKKATSRLDKDGFVRVRPPKLKETLNISGEEVRIEKILSGFILQGMTIEQSADVLKVDPERLRSQFGDMFDNHIVLIRAMFVNQIYELAAGGNPLALKLVHDKLEEQDGADQRAAREGFFEGMDDSVIRRLIGVLANDQPEPSGNGGRRNGGTRGKKSPGLH